MEVRPDAPPRLRPKDLGDWLLSRGRSVVTVDEAAGILGQSIPNAATTLHRLQQRRQVFRVARGLYVVIPPQYRSWGAVPALDFIDPLMEHLGRRYYVGLLSAAELLGASHQRPQLFQVLVDEPVIDRDFGRVRLRFYESNHAAHADNLTRNAASGRVQVSTPARTCLDLCERMNDAGGLSNVATVVAELASEHELAVDELIALGADYPAVVLRRVGYFLAFAAAQGEAPDRDLDALAAAANPDASHRPNVLLDPSAPRRGHADHRWGLLVNAAVELDL